MRLTVGKVLARLEAVHRANFNPMDALEAMHGEFIDIVEEYAAEGVDQYGLVDYSNHPKSITEIKGVRTNQGDAWTVRDTLIAALRDLDSGTIKPSSMIIVYHDDILEGVRFYQCAKTRYETVGMLSYAADRVKDA